MTAHHYHVKSNTFGALKDDVYCTVNAGSAALALIQTVGAIGAWFIEGCDLSQSATGCDSCEWCLASKAAWELAHPFTGQVARVETDMFGASSLVVDCPVGDPLAVWMERVDSPRRTCIEA